MQIGCIDNVRRAVPADAAGIASVMKASWGLAYPGIVPSRHLRDILASRTARWWTDVLSGSHGVLVAERDRTVVGYASVGANRAAKLREQGEIYEVYVAPEHQGTGIGRTLVEDARALAAGMGLKGCAAWAADDLHGAREFFAACGGRAALVGLESFGEVRIQKTAYVWR